MNVFFHELKMRLKGLSIWVISMIALIFASMIKYDSLHESGPAATAMIESFPQTLQAVFGMNGLKLSTVSGYVGICLIFIAVMAAIFAGMLGAGVIAEEEIDKTTEFLYPKPIKRSRILWQKLLLVLVGIAGMSLAIYGSLIGSTAKYNLDSATHASLVNYSLAAVLIMLMSASIGVLFATLLKHSKHSLSLMAATVATAYFAYAVSKMSTDFDFLKYGTMFRWFDAKDILEKGQLEPWSILAAVSICLVCVVAAFVFYRRRDLTV